MSSTSTEFLVELGTEELPPTALKKLSLAFEKNIIEGLTKARLNFDRDNITSFATPRRLAILVRQLDKQQPDQAIEKLGPAVAAAYDKEGKPSKAATGFAKSNGVSFDKLETVNTEKGDRLCYKNIAKGLATESLLEDIVTQALNSLPIPKRMRWGTARTEFVRPVHWLVMLLGKDIIKSEILGIKAGRESYGHRFHAPEAIEIDSPESYEQLLENKGAVIPSFAKRQSMVKTQVETVARALNGKAVIEDALLNEVTALVEKPVALAGKFDDAFLEVPNEALIYSMSEHQKYFHIVDVKGKLLPHFITVSNIESKDPAAIISGNERVIRPRLADAAFFFETDKKVSLHALRDRLKPVVFQQQLGTVYEKTERIGRLAEIIAGKLNADKAVAKVAGELCKADLASDMVLEFDKMQGISGGYYALHEGLSNEIADAIQSHYLPKFAGDDVPTNAAACAVALADRLDTLTGIFGIGQEPSGSKDPFALRRASIGALNIILKNKLTLNLSQLVDEAVNQHSVVKNKPAVSTKVVDYIFDRFAAHYQEQDVSVEIFLSVRNIENFDALDFDARIHAVSNFAKTSESESLAAANKRVSNILEKSKITKDLNFDKALLQDSAEIALANALEEKELACLPLFTAGKYGEGLLQLTELKQVVDAFFDNVMVNTDDISLKNNRLALLTKLRELFLKVADISLLVPAKK